MVDGALSPVIRGGAKSPTYHIRYHIRYYFVSVTCTACFVFIPLDMATNDPKRRSSLIAACWGSILAGVTLPVLLTYWHMSQNFSFRTSNFLTSMGCDPAAIWKEDFGPLNGQFSILALLKLELYATLVCGPGAVILSGVLFDLLRRDAKAGKDIDSLVLRGAWGGAILAFANFPAALAYFAVGFRVGILFLIAGATSGWWVAWHSYRSCYSQERFFPRYSLRTLMILVFVWGTLLAIFQPAINV